MAKLYFKYAVMKANKSLELLTTIQKYEFQNKKVLIFKPYLDDRDGSYVKSRAINDMRPASLLVHGYDMNLMYLMAEKVKPNCILVDEAQFMKAHHIEELSEIALYLNIPVICYGLLTDFQGNLFEGSKKLIELAETFKEIKTECFYCSRKAIRNMRLADGKPVFHGEQIIVGDEDYIPTCIIHYNKFKNETL